MFTIYFQKGFGRFFKTYTLVKMLAFFQWAFYQSPLAVSEGNRIATNKTKHFINTTPVILSHNGSEFPMPIPSR